MRQETHCYVVIENGKEIPNSDFSAIQGAAAMWSESPETRTVYEVICGLGTPLRQVPVEELSDAMKLMGYYK